ncbi:transcription initiation factor TFIID subunit 4-like isoform X2 [Amphibalanus amphitrite]|nr:transcription initiation factor TFIID subunit 4-like isoform X2 [Amphibalanus amphitrite]XP_043214217.1 transcription initiation factor TFIID subunit 4-like isoform X2 [Amphibalanus amphitrite]
MASQGKPMAWVTLATTDAYALGALVLAHSLRQAGTAHRLVVMITPGVTDTMRTQLSGAFDDVISVDVMDSGDAAHLALMSRPELGVTLTKLHCWTLTQFSKCVFLDADCLVMTNCDELFEREELSAAPDIGWPDCFNSGVFVFTPSQETFRALVQLAAETGSFDGGDQGLLNTHFSDWATRDISRHLPFVYNMTASATYTYLPAFLRFGKDVKIVHFLGSNKPWMNPQAGDASSPAGRFHAAWWDIYQSRVRRADGGHHFLELSAGPACEVLSAAAPPPTLAPHLATGADCPANVFRERAVEPLWAGDQRQSGPRRPTPLFDYTHTPTASSHTAPPPPPPPAPVHHVWTPPPPPPPQPAPAPVWNPPPPPPAPAWSPPTPAWTPPTPAWTPPPPPAPAPAPVWNPPPPAPAPAPVWNPPPPQPAPAPAWNPPAPAAPAPAPAWTPKPAPAAPAPAPAPAPAQPQPKPWTPPGPPPPHRPWSAEPPRPRSSHGAHRSRQTGAPAAPKPSASAEGIPIQGKRAQSSATKGTIGSTGMKAQTAKQPAGQDGHQAPGAKVSGTKTGSRMVAGSRRIRTKSPGTTVTKISGANATRVSGSNASGTRATGSGTKMAGVGAKMTGSGTKPTGSRLPGGRGTPGTKPAHGSLSNGAAAAAAARAADPESQEQRRRWEEGRIDFTGADRFDNVWRRITENLERPEQPAATQEAGAHVSPGHSEQPLEATSSELVSGLAKVSLSPAEPSPEDSARRAAWERGQMDYMGSDSFENIMSKMNQTLKK